MTNEDILCQAIEDNPDDDGPRLAYADLLEERGDVRGEFIRLQCEMARADGDQRWRQMHDSGDLVKPSDSEVRSKRRAVREFALRTAYGSLWCPRLMQREFTRGFVEKLGTFGEHDLREFLARVDEMFRPFLIRELHACQAEEGTMRSLLRLSQLARVRRLSLSGLSNTNVLELAISPNLRAVGSLRLTFGTEITSDAIRAVLDSNSLERMTELDLGARCHTETRQVEVEGNPWEPLGHTETIKVNTYYPNLSVEGVVALAESPGAARLRVLDLSHNDIGDAGAEALLGSPYLAGLEKLTLLDETIGANARVALRARFG